MSLPEDITAYHLTLDAPDQEICRVLAAQISRELPDAEAKVWHRHPVWFLDGNPLVGYHRLKAGIRVLFWSGQSFPTPGLTPNGSFQAADFQPASVGAIDENVFATWLREARDIQWNYRDIMKNKGLVKLTSF